MKQHLIIAMLFFVVACKKQGASSTPVNDTVNPTAPVVVKGVFSGSGGHNVSGTVEIVTENNQKKLVLKGFSSTGGPDLRVYLATNQQAGSFISLGQLKSTSGQQVYDITGMPDFMQHKYVLIWCQQFSVLFGSAELK